MLVLEGTILGVFYTQHIDTIDDVRAVNWKTVQGIQSSNGRALQLIRVNTLKQQAPSVGLSAGSIL